MPTYIEKSKILISNSATISPRLRILWLILTIFSVMGMADIPGISIFSVPVTIQWIAILAIAALKGIFLTALLRLCRKFKYVYYLFISIYMLLCLVNFVNYELYGFGISNRMILIFFQTNSSEITEFLPGLIDNLLTSILSLKFLASIVAFILIAYIILKLSNRLLIAALLVISIIGIVSFVWAIMTAPHGKSSFIMTVRAPKAIIETIKENRRVEDILNSLEPYANAAQVKSDHKAATVVVVVGESASKNHLSLYGYPLETSPCMDAMADSIFVFSDVIGSSTGTAGNLERILTMKKDSDKDSWLNYPMAMDMFKAAGYRTYWLSNQERFGKWGNGSGVIATRADELCYIGKISSEDALLQKYDEELIPVLTKVLGDTVNKNKFIGINLIGSHTAYKLRYPRERNYFTGSDIKATTPRKWLSDKKYSTIAAYDNSIRYTDSVVNSMIAQIKYSTQPAILIYLSDHGENVYDDRDFLGRDPKFVEVPFVIYANNSYRVSNPDIIELIRKAVYRSISTANLLNAIMTLTGTQCPEYDSTRDFLSPEYVERPRYVDEEIWIGDRHQ